MVFLVLDITNITADGNVPCHLSEISWKPRQWERFARKSAELTFCSRKDQPIEVLGKLSTVEIEASGSNSEPAGL